MKSPVTEPRTVRIAIRNPDTILMALGEIELQCREAGFDEPSTYKCKIAASELAYNILKYANTGWLEVSVLIKPRKGMQIRARDRGPGIEDIELALADNYSSSGTLGLGLPGIKRMMDEFEVVSEPGHGTEVTIVRWL
jgi:serine/threonine-protein kinase RsbT